MTPDKKNIPSIRFIDDNGEIKSYPPEAAIGINLVHDRSKAQRLTYEEIWHLEQSDPDNPDIISLQIGLAGLIDGHQGELFQAMIHNFILIPRAEEATKLFANVLTYLIKPVIQTLES